MTGRDHPLRGALHGEVHARPAIALEAPERLSHIAMLSGEDGAAADRTHLARLCERFGISAPRDGSYFHHDFGPFRLKWERHTEFCSYTFLHRGSVAAPFDETAIARVPAAWLAELPGRRMVAVHVAVEPADGPRRPREETARLIGSEMLVGGPMVGGAEAWTDFHIHGDGFSRILVRGGGPEAAETGRLVQRLLEIETYRMMALLAFPVARDVGPEVARIERTLAEVTDSISGLGTVGDERDTLMRLTRLAAEAERTVGVTRYRFSAAAAYHALVIERIGELREARSEGLPTIGEFMERRLAPAMRTCESVAARQESLSQRIARASDLLRTRIDVALQEQNRALLGAMSLRARLQLRLQLLIEGLSVVAATYYLAGLVGYLAKAVRAAGIPVPADIAVGVSVPVLAVLVWFVVHVARRRLFAAGRRDDDGCS